jgi:hypothetical protein
MLATSCAPVLYPADQRPLFTLIKKEVSSKAARTRNRTLRDELPLILPGGFCRPDYSRT